MKVLLLQHTPDPEKVVALAGRLCYSPVGVDELNEKMTDEQVQKFVKMLATLGHESPIEHVTFTFAVEGVSRALTHQLVRHRIGSYSQQSQRYVKLDQFEYIIPPAIEQIPKAKEIFIRAMEDDQIAYDNLVDILKNKYFWDKVKKENINVEPLESKEINKMLASVEKQAIEDARYVFPNACETKIVFTMNARTLLNFFDKRCCNRAQWEIRELANEMLKLVKQVAPNLFRVAGRPCLKGCCPEGNMQCDDFKDKIPTCK